jgi:hypothetical protein
MAKRKRGNQRNAKIYAAFTHGYNVLKKRSEALYDELADKHDLEPNTIARIVAEEARKQKK